MSKIRAIRTEADYDAALQSDDMGEPCSNLVVLRGELFRFFIHGSSLTDTN